MAIYLILIFLEIAYALVVKLTCRSRSRQEHLIAKVGMILIFLLLALKADTVGIDIAGYKEIYEIAGSVPWNEFSFVYFERGYVLLTKLFAKPGISFQIFTMFLYAAWCHSIYLLIRKYSPDALLSVLIFIGYSFLTFSISGLRQTLAMALCIYAFILYTGNKPRGKLLAVILTVATIFVHESAVVFFPVLLLLQYLTGKPKISIWVLLTVVISAMRSGIWNLVRLLYGETETSFTIGGNFVFLLGMLAFISYTYYSDMVRLQKGGRLKEKDFDFDGFSVRAIFLCVICYVVFSGGVLLRANMYYMLFLIPAIPRSIGKYEPRERFLLKLAMGVFMIVLFYQEALMSNQMHMWPYRFFWQ